MPAIAFIRSTSKPTILPLSSLNSFGAYGMLTPMTSFPDDLMASGTVLAMASTFSAGAALVVEDFSLPESEPLAHPDNARAPVATNTAANRQILVRRSCFPPNTVASTFSAACPAKDVNDR